MARKRHTTEDIINKLREAEVSLARGMAVPEVCRKLGVTEQTYYRWRKLVGNCHLDRVRRRAYLRTLTGGNVDHLRRLDPHVDHRPDPPDMHVGRSVEGFSPPHGEG